MHSGRQYYLDNIRNVVICDGYKGLYDATLAIIKNNGYYVKSWVEFGSKWYDIAWYDNVNGGFYIAPYPDKSQNELKQITINNRRAL